MRALSPQFRWSRPSTPHSERRRRSQKPWTPAFKVGLPMLEQMEKNMRVVLPLMERLEPIATRAIDVAGPLEGAVERLGRMIDRIPGARKREPREGEAAS